MNILRYLISSDDLTAEKKTEYRQRSYETADAAARNIALAGPYAVQQLLPQHLGLNAWITEDRGTVWIDRTTRSWEVVVIMSIGSREIDPAIDSVRIDVGGQRIYDVNLTPVYAGLPSLRAMERALRDPVAREVMDRLTNDKSENTLKLGSRFEAYFSEPVLIRPTDRILVTISASGNPVSRAETLYLSGFLISPKGMNLL